MPTGKNRIIHTIRKVIVWAPSPIRVNCPIIHIEIGIEEIEEEGLNQKFVIDFDDSSIAMDM